MIGKRILIVDDEEGIRKSLARVVRRSGIEVKTARDGYDAISIAKTFKPHLLLIDIRMPGIDGIETFRRIRQFLPSVASIFMTAYSVSQKAKEAANDGGLRVLSKPLDLESVIAMTKNALREAPVLIVEDDITLQSSISRALRAKGIDVETASTIHAAKTLLQQRPDRVVVTDVFLDDGYGYQLLMDWCGDPAAIPFVLITGSTEWIESKDANLAREKAVLMSKPIDIDTLVTKIEQSSCRDANLGAGDGQK